MHLLEHPNAQALLDDAKLPAASIRACADQLEAFVGRYLPRFARTEHRDHARTVLRGKLTGLERKTTEPIATQAGQPRRPLQLFVGAGGWDDQAVLGELRRHVRAELGHPEAVFVLDPSGFPKKGTASCGVARQWCGRLGKVDNCQVGVFLAYVTAQGYAPLDRQLYLPRDWAEDRRRRQATHVPTAVRFQESWRIGLELIDRSAPGLPFGWLAGDDEFGRVSAFRAELRQRELRYVLDVPANTLIRELGEAPAAGRRRPPWRRVDEWTKAQPSSRWRKLAVADGAKGPKVVRALEAWVQTREEGWAGPRERLIVIRTVEGEPRVWYTLSNAPADVPLSKLVRVQGQRHGVEEMFQAGKGEVGLAHYEVRSWVGWHHHMTLALLALWFLILEQRRLRKKNPGPDRPAVAGAVCPATPARPAQARADRGRSQPRAAPHRRGAHLPLARRHRPVPAAARATTGIKGLQ